MKFFMNFMFIKNMKFSYFLIAYYRHVCEPILIQQVAIDREWTGYSHMFVTLEI